MNRYDGKLGNPDYAAFAWARYRRILRWITVIAILAALGALGWLRMELGSLPVALALATFAGVGLSILVAGALMGLVFLSSGSGHDEDVAVFERKSNS